MQYKRVLLKLSGEALMGREKDANKILDKDVLFSVANQVKELVNNGIEVGVVIGGGNIFRGRYCDELSITRKDGDYMGMVGTIFNALAFKATLDAVNVKSKVLSAIDIKQVCDSYDAKKSNELLNNNTVVIFAAGTGKPYFSTDTCAAIRASEMNADLILMAKNGVDGVYNKDPRQHNDALKYDFISYKEILDKELGVIDLSAIKLCSENKIKLIVFNMDEENAIINVVNGAKIGTLIGEEK